MRESIRVTVPGAAGGYTSQDLHQQLLGSTTNISQNYDASKDDAADDEDSPSERQGVEDIKKPAEEPQEEPSSEASTSLNLSSPSPDKNVDTDVVTDIDAVHPVGDFAQIMAIFSAALPLGIGGEEVGEAIRITDLVKARPTVASGTRTADPPTPPPTPSPQGEIVSPGFMQTSFLHKHGVSIIGTENLTTLPYNKVFYEENNKLAGLEPAASGAPVTLTQNPWGKHTPENYSIFMLRTLWGTFEGKNICLAGPPIASIGKGIARRIGPPSVPQVLGQRFDRHHRNYGTPPSSYWIIQALQRLGPGNPLTLLDKVDQIGHGINGQRSLGNIGPKAEGSLPRLLVMNVRRLNTVRLTTLARYLGLRVNDASGFKDADVKLDGRRWKHLSSILVGRIRCMLRCLHPVTTGLEHLGNRRGVVMHGKGAPQLTGKLGDDIREGVQMRLSCIQSRAYEHVVGIGAVPNGSGRPRSYAHRKYWEGGTSVGTAILSAVSLFFLIMWVKSSLSKVLAVHCAGIKAIIAPAANQNVEEVLLEVFKDGAETANSASPTSLAPDDLRNHEQWVLSFATITRYTEFRFEPSNPPPQSDSKILQVRDDYSWKPFLSQIGLTRRHWHFATLLNEIKARAERPLELHKLMSDLLVIECSMVAHFDSDGEDSDGFWSSTSDDE
ncbi:hypothetical protein BDN72DRAFT_859045 [Pluteus cervinus]|uniref:Uncharacterized protein n=1 Tax=Pluteus cervinus TaxID=181527 RepID=A0ACD3AQF0_9AGAR|nr:hypothetical protein BDN72DRAFT_859045 [Pluteus cervinus]